MSKVYTLDSSIEIPVHLLTAPPFSKLNIWKEASNTHVRCYISLGERTLEDTVTGIAIDGSGSMQSEFGLGPFARNKVAEVAQVMCPYIARKADRYNGTTLIYWATGDPGEIEPHGFMSESQAQTYRYQKPKNYGRRTNLLPALKYFCDGIHPQTGKPFKQEKFGLFIFITDGFFEDMEAVKAYSCKLAQDIESGARNPLKLIIIGFGKEVNEEQMQELDDLDTGTNQDLYFHRIGEQMTDLAEIFTELVDDSMIVASNGIVRDSKGTEILNMRDTGVPALFDFDLPIGSSNFTLEVDGQKFSQVIP